MKLIIYCLALLPYNSLLFLLVNFRQNIYLRKIIFTQPKLDENNFTSRVWWALIEEIAPRAEDGL